MNAIVQLTVNETNLIQSLRHSFSTSFTFMTELLQNARRAGATMVRLEVEPVPESQQTIVRVQDNGCGIQDMQNLLSIGDSGWAADVCAAERPYGLGFLASLYVASHLQVSSLGWLLDAPAGDILNFAPVALKPIENDGFTTLTLTLPTVLAVETVQAFVREHARGFPIPVLFNGEPIVRDHALDGGRTAIRTATLTYLVEQADVVPNAPTNVVYYLQGLPLHKESYKWIGNSTLVVHLDSEAYRAVMPDRHQLVDSELVMKTIAAELSGSFRQRLAGYRQSLGGEAFVRRYFGQALQYAPEVLLSVDCLPLDRFSRFGEYPVLIPRYWQDYTQEPAGSERELLCRGQVEQPEFVVIEDVSLHRSGSPEDVLLATWAWGRGALMADHNLVRQLPAQHWLRAQVHEKPVIQIEVDAAQEPVLFKGQWGDVPVVFCQAYRLIGPDGQAVEVQDAALYTDYQDHGAVILYPSGCEDGRVICQVHCFTDDNDEHLEQAEEEEEARLVRFVRMHRTPEDRVGLLAQILSDVPLTAYLEQLEGRQFHVQVKDGCLQVVQEMTA